MSSFQDIETQNARRPRRSDDTLERMTQTEVERFVALTRHVRDAYNTHSLNTSEAPAPLRLPRTALGFGLLGPVATPDGRALDVTSA